ncbi:potassium uptake protein, TrkH family [Pseudoflavonifractor capillosus]|uniref:TrkH family potassium uptake protein n=1 Tax=Pseudoflavonifractor capillosus TaxID=106588 RepID=UPI00195BABA8|nr:potassium transporter TrkG [Pseudoflavonifractor capillosus]MBM6895930.1 potassium uptake protein, TrkH family [Pseudoflavonifractor capillosus]
MSGGGRRRRVVNSTRVIAFSFAGVILMGALLLMLPISSASGESCGFITALFTATSATCVTGLVLVDTLTQFTFFGEVVILVLIQLGGLGFMSVMFLLASLVRKRMSLSQRLMMVSAFNLNDMHDVAKMVGHAFRFTFTMEAIGAVILTACFFPRYGLQAIWKGIFTAVSAFCNAGFDLLGPDKLGSLSTYDNNPVVLLTVATLIVSGGLGFFVWEELLRKRSFRRLTLYSKMVLVITAALIVGGALFFLAVEHKNPQTLGNMPWWQQGLNALFQAITLRTAGFLSISQGGLREVSQLVCILLMLVGGSSGSTAGGIKTVTLGVLVLAMRAGLHGRSNVTIRGRTIPLTKVLSAVTLVLVVSAMFLFSSIAISLVDGVSYLAAAYETASALGTVGLTTGITPTLSTFSHLLLVAMMYLGRVGVLSFSVAFLSQGGKQSRVIYPESDVMIG